MNRYLLSLAAMLSLVGCAQLPTETSNADFSAREAWMDEPIAQFSANGAGKLPNQWVPLVLFRTKKQTQYKLVAEQGKTVLHAHARQASSGLMQYVSVDPLSRPWMNWRWKIGSIVETADKEQQAIEDSPARVILGFDGDKDTLSFSDQILFETAKVFTGYDFPYATLMYIWDRSAPIGTVMPSRRSGRIKMMVVANAADGVGKWQTFTRNIADDFESAFGEKPGKLIGVGVLTDTDNMGETVEAWYGDIRLRRERK